VAPSFPGGADRPTIAEAGRADPIHGRQEIVERAIAWALEHVGSTAYAFRCLAFVEDAYEIPNGIEVFGGDTANEAADAYAVRSSPDTPARGAFAFFDSAGPVAGLDCDWGHVGLALGDGRVVHAWTEVRIDPISEIADLPPAGGWTSPAYVGCAQPATILRTAR
jgi:cell wall-associated NlpC family hydrolase